MSNPEKDRIKRRLSWVEGEAYKNAIDARNQVDRILPKMLSVIEDREFVELSGFVGVHSRPCIARAAPKDSQDSEYGNAPYGGFGHDVLSFLVAWSFLSHLLANPIVKAYFSAKRPGFVSDLDAAASALRRHGFFLKQK